MDAEFIPCPFCGEPEKLHFVLLQVHCGICGAAGPVADSEAQAIANWNRRPTSTLDTTAGSKRFGDVVLHTRLLSPGEEDRRIAELRAAGVTMIDGDKMGGEWTCDPGDDLAQAREKRDLAGLPSLNVTAEPDGLSMEFDLGRDKPRKR